MTLKTIRAAGAPALFIALAGLAGCAGSADRGQPDRGAATTPAPPMDSAGECNADASQGSVGQALSDDLTARLQRESGSSVARVLRPGQVVTMEYNPQRLNILVDDKNTITAVRCG